ncbi:MAG: TIGR00282 family metallophosphoesterase [Candidatus Obscuribacterales bacterium]|nr:TIGR00282 family metallophosphoesterase [Candidatus Obscuribacterales bacterium]
MSELQSSSSVSILFLGDVIGKPGRLVVRKLLDRFKEEAASGERLLPDLIVANVENSSHGFGVSRDNVTEFKEMGVDVLSGGNHTFDRKDVFDFIDTETTLLRPANYPEGTPGRGFTVVEKNGLKFAVINLMGRIFMEPLQSPFAVVDSILEQLKEEAPDVILVDVHAEATAEKMALGWYLDGRVSAVVGSHTHVQTADERLLHKGTAYISDAGACGPRDGVIGMALDGVFRRMVKQLPSRFEIAEGPATACGVLIETERKTGRALSIQRIRFEGDS